MMRILIIKLSSLGDLFHALPAVHALKEASGAKVDWLVQSAYVPLVSCFTDATGFAVEDCIHAIDDAWV